MLRPLRLALVFALAVGAGACRQADGPTPSPDREANNEIGDIARDMINVTNNDPQAPDDLRSDLSKYGANADSVQHIDSLARELSQALPGARLETQTAESLAKLLWVGVTGKDLSERQVEALGRDVKATLAPTGIAEERAQSIADRLSAVQRTITRNPRRWYQVF